MSNWGCFWGQEAWTRAYMHAHGAVDMPCAVRSARPGSFQIGSLARCMWREQRRFAELHVEHCNATRGQESSRPTQSEVNIQTGIVTASATRRLADGNHLPRRFHVSACTARRSDERCH